VKVSLSNIMLIRLNPIVIPCEKDSFALTAVFRLDYECFGPSIVELFFETLDVSWEHPSIREEVVICWKVLLHRK
jgi:hypothetical protein